MWIYKGNELKDEDVPEKAIGFIYMITQISTGKLYIGRKLLTKAGSKQINGKRKKIRLSSNWKEYWSSSPQIKEWIDAAGDTQDFKREILTFCHNKSELLYLEENILHFTNAMLSDSFINENIRSRIQKSWFIKNKDDILHRLGECHSFVLRRSLAEWPSAPMTGMESKDFR